MSDTTREIRLASRPHGEPADQNFELREVPLPEPGPGEILIRNSYLSVDPYMRGRMRDVKSYIPPFQVGEVLEGGAVGQVIASNDGPFEEGAWVQSMGGWREHFVSDGSLVYPVDPAIAPVSNFLGVLGMPGITAYAGLVAIGRIEEGNTVYISAAAGAVGSLAGQLARLRGCRVVGSAGTPAKVRWLTEELGFDAAFDYHGDLPGLLREHCPERIDVYFDNVGGEHLEAAIGRMKRFGRIALCGAVSQYNEEEPPPGPRNMNAVIALRLTLRGFIVFDHYDLMGDFLKEVGDHVRSGEIVVQETVLDGLERMPEAFRALFSGDNVGKMLVRVGPDPARD